MPAEERRLNVRLDPETHRALRVEAASRDVTIQDLVEGWLREKLHLPPLREEGRKGGELQYRPNPRTASALCDHSGS